MSVNHSGRSGGGHDRDIFSIFLNMKVCCMISLKSPHRGDSNDYTQYTIFNIRKKIPLNYSKPAAIGFLQGTQIKNELKTVVVNELSVFEPLKFCCTFVKLFMRLK